MSRVEKLFRDLRKARRCGLVAYVTCGDPSVEATTEIALQLEKAGTGCIELGVPFSDPIADGPVIQAASHRALQGGTTIYDLFAIAGRIRQSSQIPLVAFSYLNPILAYGVEKFAASAANAGIDSVLITDLPPEAAQDIQKTLHGHGLGLIFLAAPTSPRERLAKIDRMSDGFVYYVSVAGVTGTRDSLDPHLLGRLKNVRKVIGKPLAVGFGISRHEHYRKLSPYCDAVVVGSAIVRAIAAGAPAGAPARASAVVSTILRGA